MRKRPWYIWLSLIAFGIISYQCRISILHSEGDRDYALWTQYIRRELFLGILTLILPCGLILFAMDIVSKSSYTLGIVINILILIYVYFGGVILSAKLYDWKAKNIDNK